MKATRVMMAASIVAAMTLSCKKKKETSTIIIPKQEVVKPSDTIAWMERSESKKELPWLNANYVIKVVRERVDSLPLAKDEIGNRYYDNSIFISITKADGSTFFEKKLTKKSFYEFLDDDMKKNGALLGFVYDGIDNNKLRFAGSVGSPDVQSDSYVPLVMLVDSEGHMSIQRDTDLDMHNQAADTTTLDDSYKKDSYDDGV